MFLQLQFSKVISHISQLLSFTNNILRNSSAATLFLLCCLQLLLTNVLYFTYERRKVVHLMPFPLKFASSYSPTDTNYHIANGFFFQEYQPTMATVMPTFLQTHALPWYLWRQQCNRRHHNQQRGIWSSNFIFMCIYLLYLSIQKAFLILIPSLRFELYGLCGKIFVTCLILIFIWGYFPFRYVHSFLR
jgi:hypothetical protein